MSSIEKAFALVKDSELDQHLRKTEDVWEKFRAGLLDPAGKMDEEKCKEYEQKIMAKLKSGKRLTSQELSFLRMHNPSLYEVAIRVERARQAFRSRLKACKSKEEVQQVISGQMEVIKAMKEAGDPAAEYMTAMVEHEAKTLRESSVYAKLPDTMEEARRKKKEQNKEKDPFEEKDKKEAEMDRKNNMGWSLLVQGQFQCDMIGQLTAEIL